MKRTEVVSTITATDRIPKQRYVMRVCGTKFGPSGSSGNPMITLEFEILGTGDNKDVVEVGDRKINVAGYRLRQYYVTSSIADPSTNGEKMGRVFDLFAACGIPKEEIDENNPPHGELLNAVVDAILYSKKDLKFSDPTAEDLAAGRKVGAPIKDSSGNPLEFFKVEIDKLLGPCQYEGSRAF